MLYNEAILITPNGTIGMRADHQFPPYRKLVKAHQNVLIFYKGNPQKIKENYGNIKATPEEEIRKTVQHA